MILCGTSSSILDILKGQKGQSEIKEGTSFGTASRFDALGLLPFPSFPWHPDSRLKVKEIGNQGCGWSPPPPHRQTSSGRFGAGLLVLVPLLVFQCDHHIHQTHLFPWKSTHARKGKGGANCERERSGCSKSGKIPVEGAVIVKGNFWIMQLNLRTIWINMLPAQWSRI